MKKKKENRKNYLLKKIEELQSAYKKLSNELISAIKERGLCPTVDDLIQEQNIISADIRMCEKKLNNLFTGRREYGSNIGTWEGRVSEYEYD
jgi:hypothetical protein